MLRCRPFPPTRFADIRSASGLSPLHYAAWFNHPEAIKALAAAPESPQAAASRGLRLSGSELRLKVKSLSVTRNKEWTPAPGPADFASH